MLNRILPALVLLLVWSGLHAAVTSEVSRTDYVGNGSVSAYSTTFPVKATTELRVFQQASTGLDTELTLGVDYSAVLNTAGLATVTLTAGNLTNGYKISIQRGIPYTQTYNPSQSGAYSAASLGTALDRLQNQMVRLKGESDRSLKIPYLEPGGDSVTKLVTPAASRANQFLAFDASGNAIVASTVSSGVVASAFMQTALDDTTATAVIATLGIDQLAVVKIDTIAAMRALTPGTYSTVLVRGYYATNDGGGGFFRWDSASVLTENGGTVMAASAGGTGRWRRIYDVGAGVSVRWFGAVGDGATHPLSGYFATLGAAQAVYPDTISLADEVDWAAIQACMNGADPNVLLPSGSFWINRPLMAKSGHVQNLTLRGAGRTSTYLVPTRVDTSVGISTANGINAMVINQDNNGKLSFLHMRFWASVSYAGYAIYALENGAISQCLFSGQIRDCWFDLPSAATPGIFYGGLNNYVIADNVFEFAKCCFILVGTGIADLIFSGNVMSNCYDSFVDAGRDTNPKNEITISGLHVYGVHRDFVIKANNGTNWNMSNISVEQSDVAPLSPTPSFMELTNCTNMQVSNCAMYNYSSAVVGTGFALSGVTGRFSNCLIQGADVGIRFTGSTFNDILFDNVSVRSSVTAAFRVASGVPTGRVRLSNCDFTDSQGALVLHTTANAMEFFASHCRFYNAGIGGAGSRNISIDTTADVAFRNCDIGRDSASALASYFIIASSASGEFSLENCRYSNMAAPTGNTTGTQEVRIVAGGAGNLYRLYYRSAVPAAGAWKIGDAIINTAPAVGSPKGWQCTVSGTPGTWVSQGNL